jgi:hypothetical protein
LRMGQMAVTRKRYQLAHITIVVAYTFFCVTVLGIEHPIVRFLAALVSALPVLWAVWVLAVARVPAETMGERIREALRYPTASARYRGITEELLLMAGEASQLLQVASEVGAGRMSPDAGFRRQGEIEGGMKRRVEKIGELASA